MVEYRRHAIAALLGLFTIVSATVLVQVGGSASPPDVTSTASSTRTDAPQRPSVFKSTENAGLRAEIARAKREARTQLASAQEARVRLERKVAQLTSQLAAQTRDREDAERASAAAKAELAAERKARAKAEDAAKSSKEALARMASRAAPDHVTPAPVPQKTALAAPQPVEPRLEAAAGAANASLDATAGSDAATSALLQGQKLFAKGDLDSARQRFEQAAKLGLAEGALALGNTYDPASLAKAGMTLTGDPTRARQWYRRAYELAQGHQNPRR